MNFINFPPPEIKMSTSNFNLEQKYKKLLEFLIFNKRKFALLKNITDDEPNTTWAILHSQFEQQLRELDEHDSDQSEYQSDFEDCDSP
jgi:hypothetical protein